MLSILTLILKKNEIQQLINNELQVREFKQVILLREEVINRFRNMKRNFKELKILNNASKTNSKRSS